MGHRLSLDVPEEVYESLVKAAEEAGQPPEELAVELLASATQSLADDPLEKYIGAFASNMPGWSDRHDEYIGKSLGVFPCQRLQITDV